MAAPPTRKRARPLEQQHLTRCVTMPIKEEVGPSSSQHNAHRHLAAPVGDAAALGPSITSAAMAC